jgi:hypothetical protein
MLMMKLFVKTLRRASVSLLASSSIFIIAGIADANIAAAGQMNTVAPNAVARFSEPVDEKHVWDWYVHPRSYAPDGLSTYSEDYTNAAQDVVGSDPAARVTKRTTMATQVGESESNSAMLGTHGFLTSLTDVGRD